MWQMYRSFASFFSFFLNNEEMRIYKLLKLVKNNTEILEMYNSFVTSKKKICDK